MEEHFLEDRLELSRHRVQNLIGVDGQQNSQLPRISSPRSMVNVTKRITEIG
jgi:hypothetical protein